MVDSTILKFFLRQDYNRAAWQPRLKQLFGEERTEFFAEHAVHDLPNPDPARVKAMRHFGYVDLGEPTFFGAQHRLALVEVELQPDTTDIARNRVGLRALTYPFVDGVRAHGVLAFYFDPEQPDYRLSFQTRLAKNRADSGGMPTLTGTDRRRYTFVLGRHEAATTAAARLAELSRKAGRSTVDDVTAAFSVERLNEDFFKQYKIHYNRFSEYLANNYGPAFGLTAVRLRLKEQQEAQEKPVRDFAKRLLGQLVFLYFLQKKGWMGCSDGSVEWTDGHPEFLKELFDRYQKSAELEVNSFYSSCLKPLFFDTLSTRRDNDALLIPGLDWNCRVPYLNGGLFEREKRRTGQHGIPVSMPLPEDVIEISDPLFDELLTFFGQYNFTIEENRADDHDVGIDPEMLGHIFENLLEENRSKGAIYTPRHIVQYMCQESLIGYLSTHLGGHGIEREAVVAFVRQHEVSPNLGAVASIVQRLLTEVKVCDPAIGSGAFPIGLLQELYAAQLYLYAHLPNERRQPFQPAEVKRAIIHHNIYGVDYDPGAVDIARLRFWLALVVDEVTPEPLPNLDYKVMQGNSLLESYHGIELHHLRPEHRVQTMIEGGEQGVLFGQPAPRQANINFAPSDQEKLEELLNYYFDLEKQVRKPGQARLTKQQLRQDIDKVVHEHLRYNVEVVAHEADLKREEEQARYDAIRLDANDPPAKRVSKEKARKLQFTRLAKAIKETERLEKTVEDVDQLQETATRPFFLWHLYFREVWAERGGFDIVIANPPYMRVQEIEKSTPELKPYYEAAFPQVTKGAYDLANLFVLHTVEQLLNYDGTACFIFPHKFFNTTSGTDFRDILLEKGYLQKVAHFGTNRLFNDADTFVCVATLTQKPNSEFGLQMFPYRMPPSTIRIRLVDDTLFQPVALSTIRRASELYGENLWILLKDAAEYELFEALYRDSPARFKDVLRIYQGVPTSHDKLYQVRIAREDDTYYWAANELEPEREWQLEKKWFRPMVRGRDVQRYEPLHYDVLVFFPYEIDKDGEARIVTLPNLQRQYPFTFGYVAHYEAEFKGRERGRAGQLENWHGFLREQNLTRYDSMRLSSMEICTLHPNVTLNKGYCHNTKVYSWELREGVEPAFSYEFLLALGNSQLLWWFLRRTGDTLKDDARTLKTNYLNPFPLPPLPAQEVVTAIERLVSYLLWLNDSANQQAVEGLPNGAVAQFFRQVLDLAVCELYPGVAKRMNERGVDVLANLSGPGALPKLPPNASGAVLVISKIYAGWQQPDSAVRSRLLLASTRVPEWLGPILAA